MTLDQQLSQKIDKSIVTELIKEYKEIQKASFLDNKNEVISAGGRFAEIVFAMLQYLHDGTLVDLNNIPIEVVYQKIKERRKNTAEEDLIFLAVPRVARSIYTIRNKKRVAHFKKLDAIRQDSYFIKSSADWIMASLIFLYSTKDESEIGAIINSLIEKKLPFVEEFEDEGIVILKKLDLKGNILVLLYHKNGFVLKEDIRKTLKTKYSQILDTTLRRLVDSKFIYIGSKGVTLTKIGVIEAEKLITN